MARIRLCAASDSNCYRARHIADARADPMESIGGSLGREPSQKRNASQKSQIAKRGDITCHQPHWFSHPQIQSQSTLPPWPPWPTTTSAAFFKSSSSTERSTSTLLSRVRPTKVCVAPNPKAATSTGKFEIGLPGSKCPPREERRLG